MRMIVSVMVVAECHHPNKVHGQSKTAHHKQFAQTLRLRALPESLKRFKRDLNAQEPEVMSVRLVSESNLTDILHQKNSIPESAQSLDLVESVWESLARWPFAHDGSEKSYQQRHAVKKHVYAIAEETQGVRDVAIECLNHHKGEVETKKSC